MLRRTPASHPPYTLFPYTTLFRSRSTSAPSRANSLKLGQLQMSALTPKSLSSNSAAAITSRRIVPEPSNCTCGVLLLLLLLLLFAVPRSEGHTSEFQSLIRIAYAACCIDKKNI